MLRMPQMGPGGAGSGTGSTLAWRLSGTSDFRGGEALSCRPGFSLPAAGLPTYFQANAARGWVCLGSWPRCFAGWLFDVCGGAATSIFRRRAGQLACASLSPGRSAPAVPFWLGARSGQPGWLVIDLWSFDRTLNERNASLWLGWRSL